MTAISLKQLPSLYVNTAPYTWVSNTTLSIPAGQLRDSTNSVDITLSAATTLDQAVKGLNGLDIGTIAASTWYYVHVVADSTGFKPAGTVLSLSATAPNMPFGYDVFKLLGFVYTASSTAYFTKFDVTGNANSHTYMWDSSVSVLSGGTSSTFAAVDLSAAVPPITLTEVILNTAFTPNAANDIFKLRKTGSSATTNLTIAGNVAAKVTQSQVSVISALAGGLPEIDYLVTASGALTMLVLGFRYYL